MTRTRNLLAVGAAVALVLGAVGTPLSAKRLDDTAIRIEINDTDGDAGIQIFLDGEGWNSMKVFDPNGNRVLNFRAGNSVGMQGITELFFESAEPSFDVQTLEELLELFPAGLYRFRGMTTKGKDLKGKARLTHALPEAPVQVFPVDAEVDPGDAVFEWSLVSDPPGSEIVGYQVIVACEEPEDREFEAEVGPAVFSITVPEEFLEGADDCKWEVLAVEASGNQTISEAEFELE
jgi:hypothetical protein